MILDGVVRSALQVLGDLSPLVAHALVGQEEHPFLLLTPLLLLDVRVEVVVPSLPALLADPSCIVLVLPGRFSAMVVHFWAPNLCTSFMRYSSSSGVHERFFPEWHRKYIGCCCRWSCSRRARRVEGRESESLREWTLTLIQIVTLFILNKLSHLDPTFLNKSVNLIVL